MSDDITIGVTEIVNNIEVTAQPNDQIVDISVTDNADNVTLNITPTVIEINVNKGSSYAKWGDIYGTLSDQTDLQNALNLKANLVGGKVPASELPSYVDDIIEVANYAALPTTGETGKIYVTLDNNKIYRWSGSIYIEIASNSAIWGAITGTLSSQTDLQNALNAKQNTITLTTTGTTGAATLVGSTLNIPNYTTDISGLVPYTGATTNVDLGTHKLTASDLVINHASGSGVAASITKGGSGEALTVVKSSGSGNAASITGGTTLISELHLTTDLADDYIASAATWNAKQSALNGTGFVKISGTTISYDNTTYLSGTVAIANGGTGATTAAAARTNLGATTIGSALFTLPNAGLVSFLRVNADNTVELLGAELFRTSIGAGTGNGSVTSVSGTGSYGGLTLTGTVTGSGDLTLGGTPTGTWPISVSGNAASVNTVFNTTNADHYITFADANNGSPTAEFLYTVGTLKYNPNTGALTAGSFVKSGGTSSQFLKADGSIDSTTYQTALTNPVTGSLTTNYLPKATGPTNLGNSSFFDNGGIDSGITNASYSQFILKGNGTNDVGGGVLKFSNQTKDFAQITGETESASNGMILFRTLRSNSIVESMRITSGGNVGIGTTSPAAKLDVTGGNIHSYYTYVGNGENYNIRLKNDLSGDNGYLAQLGGTTSLLNNAYYASAGQYKATSTTSSSISLESGNVIFNAQSGLTSGSNFSQTERMRITSGGNVGIGTTSPSEKLDVVGNGSFGISGGINNSKVVVLDASIITKLQSQSAGDSAGVVGTESNNDFKIITNNTERMRIASNGAVTVGSTITASGGFFNSDMRLKDLTDYDYNVSDIKPITYLWKDGRDNKKHVGYSAQEVQKVMPDAVNEGTDGMLSVNYVEILVAKISQMEKEIAYLKSKI